MEKTNEDVIALIGQLVSAGWKDREIGKALGVSQTTAATYRKKMGRTRSGKPRPCPNGNGCQSGTNCRGG